MGNEVTGGVVRVGNAYNRAHPELVAAKMLAADGVCAPAISDLDRPSMWSGANWRWFFENTWGPVDESL